MSETSREPILKATPILSLRPTQMTLGMEEVRLKRGHWRQHDRKELTAFLAAHMVPVIIGPKLAPYLIDHHHLARALHDEGVKSVFVTVVADLHRLDVDLFWNFLDLHGWTHPYDAKGKRRDYSALPKTVKAMQDDPYRSLAGELRNIGGFAKDSTPYSEFLWADFLRKRIGRKAVEKDYAAAVERARALAKTSDANYLPGWCAPRGPRISVKTAAQEAPALATGKKRKSDTALVG